MPADLAKEARELVESARSGVLCTNSHLKPGYPFGSVTPYAVDGRGSPLLLLSYMAMHTDNIQVDPLVSLFVAQQSPEGDALSAARVNILGRITAVSEKEVPEVRSLYLAAHPEAEQWVNFGDFAFYRLEIDSAYYIGGFGSMGWIEAIEYTKQS